MDGWERSRDGLGWGCCVLGSGWVMEGGQCSEQGEKRGVNLVVHVLL